MKKFLRKNKKLPGNKFQILSFSFYINEKKNEKLFEVKANFLLFSFLSILVSFKYKPPLVEEHIWIKFELNNNKIGPPKSSFKRKETCVCVCVYLCVVRLLKIAKKPYVFKILLSFNKSLIFFYRSHHQCHHQ